MFRLGRKAVVKIPATLLALLAFLGSSGWGVAVLDMNGNGVSDIWELVHGVGPDDAGDRDGDGISNRDEGIAGTDPDDSTSYLGVDLSFNAEGELVFSWEAKAGKLYRIEGWNGVTESWEEVAVVLPSLVDEPKVMEMGGLESKIFRLGVSDVDMDGDGLSAWEEGQLGMSDADPGSAGVSGESDFVVALRRLESPEGLLTSGGVRLLRKVPTEKEAARFLLRSTFGPTDESIARVVELGYTGWIDEQLAMPALTMQRAISDNRRPWSAFVAKDAWWRMAIVANDQLRQRMAYALSQIFVVNTEPGTVIGDNPYTQQRFYDIFVNGAFGSYRNVLEKVTYSPVMGFYLSHLNNRKTDNPENPTRFPDENFAREIMQLFTIGLWKLNPDGSRKTDAAGEFIPTYDNAVITEMAKVFTGMSHSTTGSGRPATSFYDPPRGNDYWNPMKVWDEEHEPGPKTIIDGVELDGTQTGEEEVQATLDALMSHDAMAPFVSRLMIQRFTSSNPSGSYLSRVSKVWNESVGSEFEHLGNVLKAILLDPEVLAPSGENAFRGKLREPMIRYVGLARAFKMTPESGGYDVTNSVLRSEFGQFPLEAKSVFNFYLPDFGPAGEFRETGKVSPEMQLASLGQHLLLDSRFQYTVNSRRHSNSLMDYAAEDVLAGDEGELLDRVDLLLSGGRLSDASRLAILTAMENETSAFWKVRSAVYLVSQSMEGVTLE